MNFLLYRTRLQRDLARWSERGWVSAEGRDAILRDIQERGLNRAKPATIALAAGALLLLAGIVAFVSANWDAMPRLLRLIMLFATMAALYGCGNAAIGLRAHSAIAETSFLLAAGLFGANILLIAQIYNIGTGDIPAALMLWCVGCLITAWGARARVTLLMVFGTLILWLYARESLSILERGGSVPLDAGLLLFLAPWGAAVWTAWRWRWKGAFHPAAISLIYGIYAFTNNAGAFSVAVQTALFTMIFMAFMTGGMALRREFPQLRDPDGAWGYIAQKHPIIERYAFTPALLGFVFLYGTVSFRGSWDNPADDPATLILLLIASLAVAVALAFLTMRGAMLWRDAIGFSALALGVLLQPFMLTIEESLSLIFWLHAFYALIITLWLIDFGMRGDNFWRFWGYILFAAQLMHIYARAFGSLLETSVFLILGGVMLLSASYGLHRFNLWSPRDAGGAA